MRPAGWRPTRRQRVRTALRRLGERLLIVEGAIEDGLHALGYLLRHGHRPPYAEHIDVLPYAQPFRVNAREHAEVFVYGHEGRAARAYLDSLRMPRELVG